MRILCAVFVAVTLFNPFGSARADNEPQFLFLSESWFAGKIRNTQQFVITPDGTLCIKRTVVTGKTPAQTKYDYLSPDWDNSACLRLFDLENNEQLSNSFKSENNAQRSVVNGKEENTGNSLTMIAKRKRFQRNADGSAEIAVDLKVTMTVLDLKLDAWMKGDINVSIVFKRDQYGVWAVFKNNKPFDTIVTTIKAGAAIASYLFGSSSQGEPMELKVKYLEFENRTP